MPVYEQIKQGIKLLIMSGRLEAEDQLPPIRELAVQLKVNSNTIVKVYYQLDVEGYIYSQPGTGYFVRSERKEGRDDRKILLHQITRDYIDKTLKLGFSLNDVIITLQEMEVELTEKKTDETS